MENLIRFSLKGPFKNLTLRRFIFLRHGRTDWNWQSLVMGRKDITLDSVGETQASESSKTLLKQNITSIWTSPLVRCQKTAWYTATRTGMAPHIINGLSERCWGEYEGKNKNTRPSQMHNPAGGESLDDFQTRTISALGCVNDNSLPLIVAHSGTFRVLLNATGISYENEQVNFATPILFEGVRGGPAF